VLSAGDEDIGAGELFVGGFRWEAAVERDLARSEPQPVEFPRGCGQQLTFVRRADLAGGRQDQPARTAARIGRQLGELKDVSELVALAELPLADRPRVGAASETSRSVIFPPASR
jgi:hypothetical protein